MHKLYSLSYDSLQEFNKDVKVYYSVSNKMTTVSFNSMLTKAVFKFDFKDYDWSTRWQIIFGVE